MDKVEINQQIVQMRKYVKQAKTNVINKCVKQRRVLDGKKGTAQQVAKNQRKYKKLLEEIETLMKMKPDAISKLTLAKEKDWAAILKQKDSSIADRCMAMVATYPCVQREVDIFYSNHSDLVLKIPMLLQQWGEKGNPREKFRRQNSKGNFKKSKNLPDPSAPQTSGARNKDEMCSVQSLSETSDNEGSLAYNKVNMTAKIDKFQREQQDRDICIQRPATDGQEKEDMDSSDSDRSENSEAVHESESEHSSNNVDSEDECDLADASNLQSKHQSKSNLSKFTSISQCSLKGNKNVLKSEEMKRSLSSSTTDELLMNMPLKQCATNNLKTVKMFNLNEMKELDEIPVDDFSGDEGEKEEAEDSDDSGTHSKDPFFLRKGESPDPKSDAEIFKSRNFGQDNKKYAEKDRSGTTNERFRSNWQNRRMNGKIEGSNRKERRRNLREQNLNELIKDQFPAKSSFNRSDSRTNQDKRFQFHKEKEHRNSDYQELRRVNETDSSSRSKSFDRSNSRMNQDKRFEFHKVKELRKADHQKFRRVNEMGSSSKNKRTFSDEKKNFTQKNQHFQNRTTMKEGGQTANLHPSWEAKKKMKEMANAKFQGKRTLFED